MKRLVVILATLCVAGVPLAYATSLRDRDDVTSRFDISKTAGAHNRASDQLVHTLDFYEPVPHRLPKSGPPDSVCIEIWTRSTPKEDPADYEACATPAKGAAWKGSIARKREVGPRLRVGGVKVEQPSDTRLVLRVDPDDVKRPGSYRWRTETTSFGTDCKRTVGCPDYAPDRPATALTRLSTPR